MRRGAPLKQALLDAGIGKDIYGDYSDGVLQPYFSVIAKGARAARKEEFVSIIRNCLQDIVKNGIDKKAVLPESITWSSVTAKQILDSFQKV